MYQASAVFSESIRLLQCSEELSGCWFVFRIHQTSAKFREMFQAAAVFRGSIRLLQFPEELLGCCNILRIYQACCICLEAPSDSSNSFKLLQFSEDLSDSCRFLRIYQTAAGFWGSIRLLQFLFWCFFKDLSVLWKLTLLLQCSGN